MAHTKAGGKATQKTPRAGKRLGLKAFGGQNTQAGNIIVRQRGTKFYPGEGVKIGRDHTIFAINEGIINFTKKKGKNIVNVIGKK